MRGEAVKKGMLRRSCLAVPAVRATGANPYLKFLCQPWLYGKINASERSRVLALSAIHLSISVWFLFGGKNWDRGCAGREGGTSV
jgi:hypothetical protein